MGNSSFKYLIVLWLLTMSTLHSQTCKTISKVEQYNHSDYVLLGEIIVIQGDYFKVKVIEGFKGLFKNELLKLVTKNRSTDRITLDDTWLFYVTEIDENTFQVDVDCGWSRRLSNNIDNSFVFPPPPPESSPKTEELGSSTFDEAFFTNHKKLFYFELQQDIILLRQLKNQKRIESLEISNRVLKKYMILIFSLFLVSLIIIAVLFFRNYKYLKPTEKPQSNLRNKKQHNEKN